MINDLAKIKTLLTTVKQGFGSLADSDGCMCIEGVFATAWGGAVEDVAVGVPVVRLPDNELRVYYLASSDFESRGFPEWVSMELVQRLSLDEHQASAIREPSMGGFVSWVVLNDTLKLSFDQFSELLDLLETEITSKVLNLVTS